MTSMQVSISWNQGRGITHERMTCTEQSDKQYLKPLLSRRENRVLAAFSSIVSNTDLDVNAPSTAYRLPRLPQERHMRSKFNRDYVYKQSVSDAHFLLHRDPRTSTPVTITNSLNNGRKMVCKKVYPPKTAALLERKWRHKLPPNGIQSHRLFPNLKHGLGIMRDLSSISYDTLETHDPKTPPQSEMNYSHLPTVHMSTHASALPQEKCYEKDSLPIPPIRNCDWERRLTWKLSPYDNKHFDKQGLGPNQGPFSRELPRKCMPPTNWLRMKLRQRIHMRKERMVLTQ